MVRLLLRRRRLSTSSTTASLSAQPPPRVRFCISWRKIFLTLISMYASGLVLFLRTINGGATRKPYTAPSFSSSSPGIADPFLPPQDVSQQQQQFVRENVDASPNQKNGAVVAEHQFLVWTGGKDETIQSSSSSSSSLLQVLTDATQVLRIRAMEQFMQAKHAKRNLKLCRRAIVDVTMSLTDDDDNNKKKKINPFDPTVGTQYTNDPLASCPKRDDRKAYYFYNPLEHERHVCNVLVPAKGAAKVPSDLWDNDGSSSIGGKLRQCLQSSHLFEVLPNNTALGVKPTTILDSQEMAFEDFGPPQPWNEGKCDIPCHYGGQTDIVTRRTIQGTPFQITFSMEGLAYYSELAIEPQAWKKHRYYATTEFRSEIPLPYFSFAEYDFKKYRPVEYDKAIKGALFMARNCYSTNDRERLVERLIHLSSVFRVDSISTCMHNAEPPNGVSIDDKEGLMRQYLFYFAFENQNTIDYVTEKLWAPLVAGAVPVYFGSHNIKDHVPDHSIVVANDFKSPKALAKHLAKVASDRTLYESYHAWRTRELPPHFLKRYNMTRTHSTCRTCRWAYAQMYGLGWSHDRQQLVNLQMPRHACLDRKGLLTWPVSERWFQSLGNDKDENAQQAGATTSVIPNVCPSTRYLPWQEHQTVAEHWQRTVHEHDGVIDLSVHPRQRHNNELVKHPVVLELVVPFDDSARFRQVAPGHLEWQNETSRLTLLVRSAHGTPYRRMDARTLQLKHPESVRIIVEDVDLFHEGAADAENYFGSLMKQEWETPIEVFVADRKN